MELESLVQIFGGAGVTFLVMRLWLRSVQGDKKVLIEQLKEEQQARTKELKEMLPLLSDASKGLQSVLTSTTQSHAEFVVLIKTHIDDKVIEITEKCKKK
jgi:hypothetical protein